jgi:hypothetical protein
MGRSTALAYGYFTYNRDAATFEVAASLYRDAATFEANMFKHNLGSL